MQLCNRAADIIIILLHTTSSRLTSMYTSVSLPLFHPLSLFSPFSLPPRLSPSLLMQVLNNNDFLDEQIRTT